MSTDPAVQQVAEAVRSALRARRGHFPTVMALVKQANPRTGITLRWMQSFSDRRVREPKFSKIVELGRVLGVGVEIKTTETAAALPATRHP